jgi:hypothetical protein
MDAVIHCRRQFGGDARWARLLEGDDTVHFRLLGPNGPSVPSCQMGSTVHPCNLILNTWQY